MDSHKVWWKCPPLWREHKHAKGVGHWSTASSISDCSKLHHIYSRRCRSSSMSWTWSHTHIAEWQTKWHNPPDLGLVSSVATCLALQNQKWCVVAVQLCHVHDGVCWNRRDLESLDFWHTYQRKLRPQITDNKSTLIALHFSFNIEFVITDVAKILGGGEVSSFFGGISPNMPG